MAEPRVFKRQVWVCTKETFDGCCATKGAVEVFRALREELKARGLSDTLVSGCGCTGQHAIGPTVIIHPDGIWYCQVKPDDVKEIVESHLIGGKPVERLINPMMRVTGPPPAP
ncbi:MAG: (2Fe-2S) ferredoxin domain-containing protein [bacterium]